MLPAYRTAGEPFAIPQCSLTRSDLDAFMDERRGFHTAFRDGFVRQEPRDQFFNSLGGQCSALERQSIEPMALQVEGGNVRAMQRLVSDALWDAAAMRETDHRLVQDEMGEPDGVLIIDETGFAKTGQDSGGLLAQTAAPWAKSSTPATAQSPCLSRASKKAAMRGTLLNNVVGISSLSLASKAFFGQTTGRRMRQRIGLADCQDWSKHGALYYDPQDH